MGRKPKPTRLKILEGAYDKNPQRFNEHEPQPPSGAPLKPDHFSEMASAKWDQLIGHLDSMGMLAQTDGDLLELYCTTYANYRIALDNVDRTGQVLVRKVDDKLVEVKRNPFSTELHKYLHHLQRMIPELGLSPSSRSKMVANNNVAMEDPLAKVQAM